MKVHLRANKQTNGQVARSVCGVRAAGGIRTTVNGRVVSRSMSSLVVSRSEFKGAPEADRCAHCAAAQKD